MKCCISLNMALLILVETSINRTVYKPVGNCGWVGVSGKRQATSSSTCVHYCKPRKFQVVLTNHMAGNISCRKPVSWCGQYLLKLSIVANHLSFVNHKYSKKKEKKTAYRFDQSLWVLDNNVWLYNTLLPLNTLLRADIRFGSWICTLVDCRKLSGLW